MRIVLLFLLLAIPLQGVAEVPRRVALLIGNAAYANASPLTNPSNDVRLVAEAARQAGFSTVNVRLDLGIREFQQALRDFREQADGAQVAMVYYAGHGMEGNGRNWLIPTDAGLANDRDLTYEAIQLDQVLEAIDGATLRMVVLDACRNNPFGRSWRTGTRAVSRGLGGLEVDDVLVIYAAAPGQVAADGSGTNSPFATALARRLIEPGLPVQLLGGAVRDDVLAATGGQQRPFVSASVTGTPFYLASAVASSGGGDTAQAIDTLDEALWSKALSLGTSSAYEDYLRRRPEGRYREQASLLLARLSSPAPTSVTEAAGVAATGDGKGFEGMWRKTKGSFGLGCPAGESIKLLSNEEALHSGVRRKITGLTASAMVLSFGWTRVTYHLVDGVLSWKWGLNSCKYERVQ